MTKTTLPRAQALALLQRLATDDAFRTTYQQDAATALKSAGVPEDVVDSLEATSVAAATLRAKEVFQRAYEQVRDDLAEVCLCHRPPTISLTGAGATRAKADDATTSFSEP